MKDIRTPILLTCIIGLAAVILLRRAQHTAAPTDAGKGISSERSPLPGSKPVETTRAAVHKEQFRDRIPAASQAQDSVYRDWLTRFDATPLGEKLPLILEIREAGFEQAVFVFSNELTNKYHGQEFSGEQRDDLIRMVQAMGRLARRFDSAYAFLKSACDFEFWRHNRHWRLDYDAGGITETHFVGYSIKALGSSGRPEAVADLEELKQTMSLHDLDKASGAFVDAAYTMEKIRDFGFEGLKFPSSHEELADFHEWTKSESGQRLLAWLADVRRRAAAESSRNHALPGAPAP